jgi:hypothetical protein
MTKRNWVYVALLVFVSIGAVIDIAVWPLEAPPLTWNDVVQTIGIVVFVYWWEVADAKQFGQPQSGPARVLTVFVPPLGHAIYLYQSRNWKRATVMFLLFWAGVFVAFMMVALGVALLLDVVDPIILQR